MALGFPCRPFHWFYLFGHFHTFRALAATTKASPPGEGRRGVAELDVTLADIAVAAE